MTGETKPENWKKNPGEQPRETKKKRVVVRLNNGSECGREPVTTVTPPGWAADTCSWALDDEWPFAIAEYLLLD